MPGFSDEERERIREQLIESGRELLLTYGPKKTTVKDVTDPVGIAKPTFYQFFDAKSDLYIEILQRELEEYLESVRSEVAGVDDPQEALERFFGVTPNLLKGVHSSSRQSFREITKKSSEVDLWSDTMSS